jgi:pyridoxamine 5'-phosphate oxidase
MQVLIMLPPFHNDLQLSLAHAWAMLARGVADRRSAFHTPTLATVDADGVPQARTVILRGCDVPGRMVRIHTDRRSSKVSEIRREPRVGLHFYDAGQKIQLRLAGRATLHTSDDVAATAWASARPMSRVIYGQTLAQGVEVDTPATGTAPVVPDGSVLGYENFLIIRIEVQAIEWLYLGHQGHRRARFAWRNGERSAQWLAP